MSTTRYLSDNQPLVSIQESWLNVLAVYDKSHHIRERFPDKKHIIGRLMAEDPDFLSLCEDYDTCDNALQYWAKSKEPEAEIRVHEYRNLIQELEKELVEAIIALEPR